MRWPISRATIARSMWQSQWMSFWETVGATVLGSLLGGGGVGAVLGWLFVRDVEKLKNDLQTRLQTKLAEYKADLGIQLAQFQSDLALKQQTTLETLRADLADKNQRAAHLHTRRAERIEHLAAECYALTESATSFMVCAKRGKGPATGAAFQKLMGAHRDVSAALSGAFLFAEPESLASVVHLQEIATGVSLAGIVRLGALGVLGDVQEEAAAEGMAKFEAAGGWDAVRQSLSSANKAALHDLRAQLSDSPESAGSGR